MFFNVLHKHSWSSPRRFINCITCYECSKKRRLQVNIDDEPKKRKLTALLEKPPNLASVNKTIQ